MRCTLLFPAALALASCHDDSSGAAAFDPLVTNLIQTQTTETGAPVEVNGRSFVFTEDENAFDDVLPADGGAVVE